MNHYYQTLFDYVEQLVEMPDSDKRHCLTIFKPVVCSKNTILEEAGKIPLHHNFIISGHMRNFHINEMQEEITVDLNEGPRFFTSYTHFVNQTISNESLHCITDCEILRISWEDFDRSEVVSISRKDFTIKLFQRIMEEEKQKLIDKNTLSSEQQYYKFIKKNPNIHANVPLKYIASYLGMTQRHLSRLRNL